MSTKFMIIGLPASVTSTQLRQLLAVETGQLDTVEMLPDTIATGVAYVQTGTLRAGRRAVTRLHSLEHALGVRLFICGEESRAFQALVRRLEAEHTHMS